MLLYNSIKPFHVAFVTFVILWRLNLCLNQRSHFKAEETWAKPAEGCLQDTIYLKGRLRSIDVLHTPPHPAPWLNARQEGTNIEAWSSETLWSSSFISFLRHLWNNNNKTALQPLKQEWLLWEKKKAEEKKKKKCKILPATLLQDLRCCPEGSSSPQVFGRKSNHSA